MEVHPAVATHTDCRQQSPDDRLSWCFLCLWEPTHVAELSIGANTGIPPPLPSPLLCYIVNPSYVGAFLRVGEICGAMEMAALEASLNRAVITRIAMVGHSRQGPCGLCPPSLHVVPALVADVGLYPKATRRVPSGASCCHSLTLPAC